MGGKSSSSAPAPDPRLIDAQIKSMGIQDASIQKLLTNSESMMPLQKEQMQFGLDSAREAYAQSQDDRGFMLGRRQKLSGLQDTLVNDATTFNAAERTNELAGQAAGDVNQGFSNVRGQQSRGMSRMGVDPNSGRALAMGNQTSIAQAAALAGASNGARTSARMEGRALTDRASNALAGYPAMSMQASGAGAGYGASGIGMANAGLAGMNSGYGAAGGMAGQMGQNASGMYGAMGSYKNGQDNIAASNDPMKTLFGAAAGIGSSWLMKGSDRRLKTDIDAVGTLDNGLTVYRYRYRAGGPFELGVMADEVAIQVPEAYVSGGAGDGFDAVMYDKL